MYDAGFQLFPPSAPGATAVKRRWSNGMKMHPYRNGNPSGASFGNAARCAHCCEKLSPAGIG